MVDVRDWTRSATASLIRVPGSDDDKYSRGVVGLITGSAAYPGAAVLGVEAAWRSGAGYVRYIGEGAAAAAVIARRPETVVAPTPEGARVDAWVIGSGIDAARRAKDDEKGLRDVLNGAVPVVVDAGALDLVSRSDAAPRVLTPHGREFDRLVRRFGIADDAEPAALVARIAADLDAVVLRKGSQTLVADPAGAVIRVEAGTGWLATAGTGDVLAGVLGALLAANPAAPIVDVAAAAAWLHGHAGRIAAGVIDAGAGSAAVGHPIVALDVAEALPAAIADVLA